MIQSSTNIIYALILFFESEVRMNNEDELLYNIISSSAQQQQTPIPVRKKRKLNGQQRDEATIREKHRMLKLNKAYSQLRLVLPVENKCKLSRIETLRTAVNYIHLLSQLLEVDDNNQ
jgi:hypothetical protein